jgi:hypothetical protein
MSNEPPPPQLKRIKMGDFAAGLARRREALGNPELPRNSGKRRKAGKRALLKAIEDAGGKWRRDLPRKCNLS